MTSGSVVVIVSITPVGRVSQNSPVTLQHVGEDAVFCRMKAQEESLKTTEPDINRS